MVNYEDNCKVVVSIFWPKKQLLVLAHLNFEIRQQNSYAAACPLAKLVWRWRTRPDAARRARLQEGVQTARDRLRPNSAGPRSHTHAAPARAAHMAQVVHGAAKRARRTTRHQLTSSLLSSERVVPGSPIACIRLNRRVLTWLYKRT